MTSYVDDNAFPKVILTEGSAPASPVAGKQSLFIDSATHHLKRVNSSGTVVDLESGGGSTTLAGDTDVSISSPLSGNALIYNGTAWVNLYPWKVQLAYTVPTGSDLFNGVTATTGAWTDLVANQSFTVDLATSLIELSASFGVSFLAGGGSIGAATRLVIDSAGTPVNLPLGGVSAAASGFCNPFTGAGPRTVTGLAAGSHTVKIQYWTTATTTIYLRSNTNSNIEFGSLTVIERK